MAMSSWDRNNIRYLSMPLRDFITERHATVEALCECANLVKVIFVLGESVQDRHFLKEHFRNETGLRNYISAKVALRWKLRWAKDTRTWLKTKQVQIDFKVINAFKAAELKIDNLRWM
jgi:hypothetical protein